MTLMKACHIWISGKVQGVYYRVSMAKKAKALGLTGWVRNAEDGRVEGFTQGSENAVAALIHWCHQGPVMAKVDEVELRKANVDQKVVAFDVLR